MVEFLFIRHGEPDYTEIDKTNNKIVFQLKFNKMNGITGPFYRIYHINPFDYVNVDYN